MRREWHVFQDHVGAQRATSVLQYKLHKHKKVFIRDGHLELKRLHQFKHNRATKHTFVPFLEQGAANPGTSCYTLSVNTNVGKHFEGNLTLDMFL